MSDRRRAPRCLVLGACVLAALRGPALGAQPHTQDDALRDYWAARSNVANTRLNRLRFSADSANTDTAHALRFDIISSASLAPLSHDIARLADSLVRASWVPPRLEMRPRFIVHSRQLLGVAETDAVPDEAAGPNQIAFSILDRDGGRTELTFLDSANPAIGAARIAVRSNIVDPLLRDLDPDLVAWLAERPPVELPLQGQWRNAWLQLATFPSLPARGCLVGEMRACEAALGLSAEPNPIRAWYNPSLRQVLGARGVLGWRGENLTEVQRNIVDSCASGKDDAACIRFLSDTALGANSVEPGPRALRALLVRYAFSFPTDSAARAQAAFAPGLTVNERLARASGMPFDELLRRFHQQLSERRPPPTSPGSALLWTSSIWCLVLGAVSLGSTRWRG